MSFVGSAARQLGRFITIIGDRRPRGQSPGLRVTLHPRGVELGQIKRHNCYLMQERSPTVHQKFIQAVKTDQRLKLP